MLSGTVPNPRLRTVPFAFLLCSLLLPSGCGRLHPGAQTYVYVVTPKTYLRDRLAVVANHVADIHNGERLAVVERDSRFYKVRTPDGKVGWLEEHLIIDQGVYDQFQALVHDHAHDPVVGKASLLNEIYLHLTPGRKTDHFYLLPANDQLQLLERASVPKPLSPLALLAPKPLHPRRPAVHKAKAWKPRQQSGSTIWAEAPPHPDRDTAPDLDPDQPWMAQPMEDWWLVRDSGGHVGWILGRSFDVDIPDEVAQYSEGRRIVGAYLLDTVMDNGEPPPKSENVLEKERKAALRKAKQRRLARKSATEQAEPAPPAAPAPVPHPMGQYVTLTAEYKSGLPYDWDQVRVFIWNTHKHRYETAYRLREQQGFLPLVIGKEPVPKMGEEPTFTIRTTPDGVVTQAPDGTFRPKTVDVTQYRLEGGIVRRDTPLPGAPAPDAKGPAAPHAKPVRKAPRAAAFRRRHQTRH